MDGSGYPRRLKGDDTFPHKSLNNAAGKIHRYAHVAAVVRLPDDLADARFPSLALLPGFQKAHGGDVAHVVQAAQFRVDPSRLAGAEAALKKVYAQYGLVPVTLQDNLAPVRQAVAVEARTLQVAALVAALAGLLVATQVLGRAIARLARHHDAGPSARPRPT